MAATAAAKNRKIRQEALRDQLQAQGHLQHLVDIATKLREQHIDLEATSITSLKAAADLHCKMINKYLPDLKSVEITGDEDNPVAMSGKITVELVGAN